jgi:acetyl-CoA C-acetyltransferase
MLGEGSSYVAGGVEAMSGVPFQLPGARYGWRLGAGRVRDPLAGDEAGFIDPSCRMVMGATADRLAQRYGITREEADAFAWRSNQRALAANADGSFAADLVAIGDLLARDEHPRDSTPEQLATLRTIFTEDGVCTAGNSSGINDGGGAMLVASDARARELGVVPRGRIVSWGITGCDPAVMGIGPVVATRLALDRAGLTLDDLDVIEINEAFAAQVLAVGKELEWDDARVNPHGGAVALGHPLGASGARLVVMLLRELEERDGGFGVATACIGGGQGIALIIERLGSR